MVENVEESVRIALEETEKRLQIFEELAQNPLTMDELVRAFLIQSGADLSNPRSVRGVYFNAQAFVSYLVDENRFQTVIDDCYLKYVRPNG